MTDPMRTYADDGFYIHPKPLLDADLVRAATSGMDSIRAGVYDTGTEPMPSPWKPGDDPQILCKIELPQRASTAIGSLVSDQRLGELAAKVTGADWVQVWWVQLLYKPPTPPKPGVNVGWHQDRQYWSAWEEGSELFTAWVALSDVAENSGPMRFVPGSHQWGLLGEGDFFGQDLSSQRQNMRLPEGVQWREEVPAILPPGGVSFHDCLTFHASGENTSAGPRRSLAIHMRTAKSKPIDDRREGLTRFLDDLDMNPVIYGA